MEETRLQGSDGDVHAEHALLFRLIVVSCVVSLWIFGLVPQSLTFQLLGYAILSTLAGLFAIWLTLGGGHWYMRALAVLPFVAILRWIAPGLLDLNALVMLSLLVQWVTVAAMLLALRGRGFSMVSVVHNNQGRVPAARYSLRDMIAFVALSAIVIQAAIALVSSGGSPHAEVAITATAYVIVGVLLGLIALLSVFVVLMVRRPELAAPPLCIVVGGLSAVVDIWLTMPVALTALFAPLVMQIAVLSLYRNRGYRLLRPSTLEEAISQAETVQTV